MLVEAQSPDPEDFVCDICRASISSEQQLVKHRQIHSQSWWPSTRAYGNNSLVSPPRHTLIDTHPQNSSEVLNNIFGSKLTTPSKFQNTFRDEENSSPHSNQFLTPTKYQSPSHFQTPSKFQSPMQSQIASSPLEIDLLVKKKLTDSLKVIAKSQQKLITCTFCFLPLATEKLLKAHLLEKHQFADVGSRNSNAMSRNSNDSVNNGPDHETVVKMEPGTSPPIAGSQQKYKCSKCNYRNVYDEVKQHQRMLHTDCKFMCDYTLCTYLFTTANGLRKHMSKNHGQHNPFICEICEQIFLQCETLEVHTCRKSPISKGKSLQCKFKCGYRAKSNWDVNRHGNDHCVLNPDRKVKCRQCNMFIAQSEIAQHKEEYHQPELVNTRRNLRQCDNSGKVVSS